MKILITGSSGFIGYHVAKKLLDQGHTIIGIDNENDYYDVALKQARRQELQKFSQFFFYPVAIENLPAIQKVFSDHVIDKIIHLAAQAWVRYSLVNPYAYIQTNIVWFHNIIELAKNNKIKNFVYASSASVYGNNAKMPFAVGDKTDEPLSLYGATKKSNELIAHSYSFYFGLPTIWLRFFNVYGPRGRPDGAFFIFLKGVLTQTPIDVFNEGKTIRNFTYIDDVVEGILQALDHETQYDIFNLWNTTTVTLNDMISHIEKACGMTTQKNHLPADKADISESWVDIQHTVDLLGWQPGVDIETGIKKLVQRYRAFYHL